MASVSGQKRDFNEVDEPRQSKRIKHDDGQGDGNGNARANGCHNKHVPLWHGCRSVEKYERLERIGEGVYGVVYRAKGREQGDIVALKQVRMDEEVKGGEGFPLTALRETNVLLSLDHVNIIRVREMVVGSTLDKIFMVLDYCDHDLKMLMKQLKKSQYGPNHLRPAHVKCLMLQLLSGLAYLHHHWYIHRDLKPSNLLMGNDGILRLCDFGMARKYGRPVRHYTQNLVTPAYRCPELLLGADTYGPGVDVWSAGCIFAEMVSNQVLFQASQEGELLKMIFSTLGSPTEKSWPGYSKLKNAKKFSWPTQKKCRLRERLQVPAIALAGTNYLTETGYDLLLRMLTVNPDDRIGAEEALQHPWFSEAPLPADPALLPKYSTSTETGAR
eukprot:gb/GECG01012106.1/.p1 GENE.gb/GECG01012106.1/~~gb/GECG01012106.1/.p1  ORF type:complete len:386 (+),score=31.55 gb/GECG01012106.1/:1-1158(+)